MARVALSMSGGEQPAELGPCARPRFTAAHVREALSAAGHQLVDGAAAADVRLVDVAEPDAAATAGNDRGAPLVLVSLGRPVDPWRAIDEPAARQPFIDPWTADLTRRRDAALGRRARAYADSLATLLAGIELALTTIAPRPPALEYLGALFNDCACRPGAVFELGGGRPLVLGRGVNADLHVMTPSLARAHLGIEAEQPHILQLTDLGGSNGTWLCQPDGELIALRPGEPVHARSGALVMPDGSFRFLVA
jgi:hypothetical protein